MAAELREVLKKASDTGLVAPDKIEPLSVYLDQQGVGFVSASAPAYDADFVNPDEESEMPRFIRGYHDVLITIGVLVTLVAIAGLWSFYAMLAAVIVLSEIFVKRQRLALPSFVLAVACLIAGTLCVVAVVDSIDSGLMDDIKASSPEWINIISSAVVFVLIGLYYWRYRVPVAFAGLLIAGVAAILGTLGLLLFPHNVENAMYFVLLTSGVVLTVAAIVLDISDPVRVTRRSDIAFWLYLVAVPAILKTVFDALNPGAGTANAVAMVVAVALMMLLGLVLDRRAFVTAGLVYLGYAFSTLLQQGGGNWFANLEGDARFMSMLLAVGIVVLGFGLGWRLWRRLIITHFPDRVLARLPQIR
ncbi:hypothetical protein [Rhizobium sp. L1K21]|uniref:hypothetical protein n=1 Tax=Rhizobium sp. L1K21 TaxID=2954933 RepID=UPI00209246E4|nr:hypothetical protein [Rhizobium sp. L1K21]MCO6185453.1 hypothetical protein [Rhizobium sp. L1K21]